MNGSFSHTQLNLGLLKEFFHWRSKNCFSITGWI